MTALRQRKLEDMQIRNLAPATQRAYVEHVSRFARHVGRSPALLGPEEIRAYLVDLTTEKQLAPSTIIVAVAALRFLDTVTLQKPWSVAAVIPAPTQPQTVPVILSPAEVVQFLDAVTAQPHRTILTVCDAAGLRISEAVPLTLPAIDRPRMVLHVKLGKGPNDRDVMRSPTLLTILRDWWRVRRPRPWLCPGDRPGTPLTTRAVNRACRTALRRCQIPKPITPHSRRHALAVPLLDTGTDVRTIPWRLGHRRLATTARYLAVATTRVGATASPLDWLPRPVAHASTPGTPPSV